MDARSPPQVALSCQIRTGQVLAKKRWSMSDRAAWQGEFILRRISVERDVRGSVKSPIESPVSLSLPLAVSREGSPKDHAKQVTERITVTFAILEHSGRTTSAPGWRTATRAGREGNQGSDEAGPPCSLTPSRTSSAAPAAHTAAAERAELGPRAAAGGGGGTRRSGATRRCRRSGSRGRTAPRPASWPRSARRRAGGLECIRGG